MFAWVRICVVGLPLLLTATADIALAEDAATSASREVATPSKEEVQKYFDSQKALLQPVSGKVDLPGGKVRLNLPQEFGYLNPQQAEVLLHNIWGNPAGQKTLGIILPSKVDVQAQDSWAIVLGYNDDGHVSDADAAKINYGDLLKEMQQSMESSNEERKKSGYPAIHLVGWAEEPRYDPASHKMYWAKELAFTDDQQRYLNYDIRALGRDGVFVMSVVGMMGQLPMIHASREKLLSLVEFTDTQRYEDFNASTDRVAAYGMAGMVAAGVAAKAGLFKWLIAGAIAMKKFLIIGVVAVAAFFKKFLGGRKKN